MGTKKANGNEQVSQTSHEDMSRYSMEIVKILIARRGKSLDTSEGLFCFGEGNLGDVPYLSPWPHLAQFPSMVEGK